MKSVRPSVPWDFPINYYTMFKFCVRFCFFVSGMVSQLGDAIWRESLHELESGFLH